MNRSQQVSQDMIAGVVVLFNSPPECLNSIKTYLDQVQKLYVVDNSPVATTWILNEQAINARIVYDHLPQNAGIATALNTGARRAINDGFAYLLTMDDDSQALADMVSRMLAYLNSVPHDTIGILAPRHQLTTAAQSKLSIPTAEAVSILTTMTSGNLLNLSIYQKVGPFYDDLFIDVVDHEYNLRLKAAGYSIIELTRISLIHRLGYQKKKFGLSFISHTPARNYYLVRNSLFVANIYWRTTPGYILTALKTTLIEFGKAAALEDKPLKRLHLIIKGIADGLRKSLGRLD